MFLPGSAHACSTQMFVQCQYQMYPDYSSCQIVPPLQKIPCNIFYTPSLSSLSPILLSSVFYSSSSWSRKLIPNQMSNLPPPQWSWRPTKLTPGLPTPPVWSRVLWRCFRSFSTLNKKHSFIFLSTLKSYKILNKIISQNKRWLPTAWNVLFLQCTRDGPGVQL